MGPHVPTLARWKKRVPVERTTPSMSNGLRAPTADTALTELAEKAVDALDLGKNRRNRFFLPSAILRWITWGHEFGPPQPRNSGHSGSLGPGPSASFFAHLDRKVGRGNYVVALSADHGVGAHSGRYARDRRRCWRLASAGVAGKNRKSSRTVQLSKTGGCTDQGQ